MAKVIQAKEAQRLVDEGRVKIILGWSRGTAADVQGDHGLYATTVYTDGTFYCSCPWGQAHPFTDDLCAHALALRLVTEEAKREERGQ